ncbi:MAG: cytochrome D1 domain-containing protein [Burkholderiaceae bacterium]|jgi:mono/diheme cytochrome c family protein/sugar lactone lactonase YvrE|nr:cytochrome D1 domain-containing protein [Burkholderiaceae bacterium]
MSVEDINRFSAVLFAVCALSAPVVSGAATAPAESSSPGAKVYVQQCAACHQPGGEGVAGAFPPQKGHTSKVYAANGGVGGRAYLAHVLLYGLTGPIKVEGKEYNGNMPAWGGQLGNQQIADVLNYLLAAFGNNTDLPVDFRPYSAADIAAQAGKKLDGKDVHGERRALSGLQTGDANGTTPGKPVDAKPGAALKEVVPQPVYVAVQNSGDVEVLPSGQAWPGVEGAHYDDIAPDGSRLLVSGFKTGNVYVIDATTGKIRGSVPIGGVAQGVAIAPDGRYGLAMAESIGLVAVIDLDKLELVKKIPVGKMPHNARFSADGKLAYVTLQGEGKIGVIDMATLTKIRDIPTPGLDTPHNLDLSDDGRYLWVRDFVGHVGVLDLQNETMIKVLGVGKGHGGIDVVPGGKYVATGAIADSVVTIIDQSSREIVANVKVGTGPHGVRASKDGRWIYAAVTADNAVAVIDTRTLELARQIPLDGKFPFWVAVPGNP